MAAPPSPQPLRTLAPHPREPTLWYMSVMYFCYAYCISVYLDWLPTYLKDHRGFSLKEMGFYATPPHRGHRAATSSAAGPPIASSIAPDSNAPASSSP